MGQLGATGYLGNIFVTNDGLHPSLVYHVLSGLRIRVLFFDGLCPSLVANALSGLKSSYSNHKYKV
jgi:hypothetical protein